MRRAAFFPLLLILGMGGGPLPAQAPVVVKLWNGNIHDKKLYDQTGVKLRDTDLGDLGYLGTNLRIPHKASKYHKLTKKQKMENKAHSSVRIMIEHVFASLKQWRILSYRFRNQLKTYHMKFVIVAGLYNLKHC